MIANRRVLPVAAVKIGVKSGTSPIGADAEQRAEGVERVIAPVKAEGRLR